MQQVPAGIARRQLEAALAEPMEFHSYTVPRLLSPSREGGAASPGLWDGWVDFIQPQELFSSPSPGEVLPSVVSKAAPAEASGAVPTHPSAAILFLFSVVLGVLVLLRRMRLKGVRPLSASSPQLRPRKGPGGGAGGSASAGRETHPASSRRGAGAEAGGGGIPLPPHVAALLARSESRRSGEAAGAGPRFEGVAGSPSQAGDGSSPPAHDDEAFSPPVKPGGVDVLIDS